MNQLRNWFSRQKLNVKFTVIIGLIVFLPVCAIVALLFRNLSDNMNKHAISNLKYSMSQTYASVQKTVDLCNTSTQVFLSYQNLSDFLIELKQSEEMDTYQLLSFYKNDIGMLEKIVNSNPYLYQIRVYAYSDSFSEMMPILYQHNRMLNFPWAKDYKSGEWEFDYMDSMSSGTLNYSNHTMGLITSIEDYEQGEIGVIEVAVRMEDIFENIFSSTDSDYVAFVNKEGTIYSGAAEDGSIWEENKEKIVPKLIGKIQAGQEAYYLTTLLKQDVSVGILPMRELSGYFIHITNLQGEKQELGKMQFLYAAVMLIILVLLIILINSVVKVLLNQFYNIVSTVKVIQEGELDARVTVIGNDEMGQFGRQVNTMLDTIDRLMRENLNRELLMKNSEIKALQNQINAHFIYNVLESIKMMAEIDEEYPISDAVTTLGKLLRYGMKWSAKNVTVEQEVEYVKNYLALMNLRYDYEIILALNIPELIYGQEIPKMTLQPIVENAIYHGIEELGQDASIYIKAIMREQDFDIEITDSGKGMSAEELERLRKKITGEIETTGGSGNGIGLKNVQDRIHISFGEAYGVHIVSKENCYTKVIVTLPITSKGGN